jgi:hypothetical protein
MRSKKRDKTGLFMLMRKVRNSVLCRHISFQVRPDTTITSFRGLMLGFTPESGEYRGGRRFQGVQGLKTEQKLRMSVGNPMSFRNIIFRFLFSFFERQSIPILLRLYSPNIFPEVRSRQEYDHQPISKRPKHKHWGVIHMFTRRSNTWDARHLGQQCPEVYTEGHYGRKPKVSGPTPRLDGDC